MKNTNSSPKKHASFGKRLKSKLKELGLSQAAIQNVTGASAGSVSGWVSGTNKPQKRYLSLLAEALEVEMDWLINGDVEAVNPTDVNDKATDEGLDSDPQVDVNTANSNEATNPTTDDEDNAESEHIGFENMIKLRDAAARNGGQGFIVGGDPRTLFGQSPDSKKFIREIGELLAGGSDNTGIKLGETELGGGVSCVFGYVDEQNNEVDQDHQTLDSIMFSAMKSVEKAVKKQKKKERKAAKKAAARKAGKKAGKKNKKKGVTKKIDGVSKTISANEGHSVTISITIAAAE